MLNNRWQPTTDRPTDRDEIGFQLAGETRYIDGTGGTTDLNNELASKSTNIAGLNVHFSLFMSVISVINSCFISNFPYLGNVDSFREPSIDPSAALSIQF